MTREGVFIHPLAVVHDVCEIGAGTKIWQFASLLRGAKLGRDCIMASGACFDGSVAGDRTILCHNLAAGPGFLLGNDVFIAPNVTFANDAWPRAHKIGFDPKQFDGTRWAIVIEDGATVGAGAVVLPGVRIDKNAMIGAGAVVSKDVPADHMILSNGVCFPIGEEEVKRARRMRFAADAVRTRTWAQEIEAAR